MNEPFINACRYLVKKNPKRYKLHTVRFPDKVVFSCECKLHGVIGAIVVRLGLG